MTDLDFRSLGFVRVAAVAPQLAIAEPRQNVQRILDSTNALAKQGAALIAFPELCLCGYTAEDLLLSTALQEACRDALETLASAVHDVVIIVGLPWVASDNRLLNCAAVIADGKVQGMVPKTAHPNYGEFYERRWFVSGEGVDDWVADDQLGTFRVTTEQVFATPDFRFGIEICEDLWAPEPPGVRAALAGADVLVNLSASNELIGKTDYRRDLVRMTSARCISGYLYVSSGPTESTKDVVFGGHLIAAENGQILAEDERFALAGSRLVAEFDITKLRHERMQNTTFGNAQRPNYRQQPMPRCGPGLTRLQRQFDKHPFVPEDEAQFNARAQEVIEIQATGLARRMMAARVDNLVIGLSGGLDSTLAFLVALNALRTLGKSHDHLLALTLPGPGTSRHTLTTAKALGTATGVQVEEIDIDPAVQVHLADLAHEDTDVVFENAQARERTQILFNYANKHNAIVVGTGDLSELALGWCTFNADHMANYNVNASVPKTMIAYLVRWYGQHHADSRLADVLQRVLDTPISPELMPLEDGAIGQKTEDLIGPYELHDFFLYHYLRNGSTPEKIYHLAYAAFADDYSGATVKRWLAVFFRRFFTQQFKRTTLPPGPKVGTVSLSPRGDWRMPDEASVQGLLDRIEALA